ncbi:polyprenyl synthetase family protein [Paenibacillus yanchengensis]|uniref:Polyprenyl synthetase family protein n=1 Tax=Paenibacillus yanchengensis TaxID=2035833 RepID=A0ABW4YJQ1_9BACL
MKLLDLYAKLKGDLNYIEQELEKAVSVEHRLLSETSLHLLKAGGKRLRPVMILLAGKFGNYELDVLKNIAVPLELIHMASLVHDDVIDDAMLRRGQPTVKAKWDNRIAMYTGDYIHGKALTIATKLENPLIHQVLAKAIVQMCIGEMEQIRDFFNVDQTIRNYLLRIRRKTALLIAVSCQLGALAADCSPRVINALYSYGYNVGMAFQVRDDLLDLYGTEKQIGKPPGSDLRQGNITLPVIIALQDPQVRTNLLSELAHIRTQKDADSKQAVALVKASNGGKFAEQLADRYIAKALHAITVLPNISEKKNLIDIAHFAGKRSF